MKRAALTISLLSLLAAAGPAGAASVSVPGPASVVIFTADADGTTATVGQSTSTLQGGGCGQSIGVLWTFAVSEPTSFPPPACLGPGGPTFGCSGTNTSFSCTAGPVLIMSGGAGGDSFTLTSGFNSAAQTIFDLKGGNDTASSGGAPFSQFVGGTGDDTLTGNAANELFVPGTGADTVTGGEGTDEVSYDEAGRTLGVDVTLSAGANDDGSAEDQSNGKRDHITGVENVAGTDFADRLVGTGAAEALSGNDGNDVLEASGGNDTLKGATGSDRLDGGAGDDTLNGGGDDDVLIGGPNADVLNGDTGSDTVDYSTASAAEGKTITVDAPGGSGNDGSLEDVGAGNARDDIRTTEKVIGGPATDDLRTTLPGITLDGGGGADFIAASASGSTLQGGPGGDVLNGSDAADVLRGDADADQLDGNGGDDTLDGGTGADGIDGGAGTDTADYSAHGEGVVVSVDAGTGDDGSALDGPPGGRDGVVRVERLVGTPFADLLAGAAGNDVIEGGDGDDTLRGGEGTDRLLGGAGADVADFADRAVGVTLTLDGVDNDGVAGENEHFEAVEGLRGGSGPDSLTGSFGDDPLLDGGPGDDALNGQSGADGLVGGDGNDGIAARDGSADSVDCGAGADSAVTDGDDAVANCESVRRAVFVEDDDADGISATVDCNDRDPKIKPGAVEIVGNDVDENCDGIKAPFPRLDSTVAFSFRAFSTYTILTALSANLIPAGAKVKVTCKAKGKRNQRKCPRSQTKTFKKTTASTSFTSRYKKRRLPVGTVVKVEITAPSAIGKVVSITIRKRRAPSRKTTCLDPAGKTISCT